MENKIAYVGIDASITSTAVYVNLDGTEQFFNYTTKEKLDKWKKQFEPIVKYRHILYDYPNDYSDSEVYKVIKYNDTAKMIADDIQSICDGHRIIAAIEGYSYSSASGRLLDLVTFGSALRKNIIDTGAELSVISPKTLKTETCKMSYNIIDKKKVWRDPAGLAGGSFKKPDMMRAALNFNRESELCEILALFKNELLTMKNLPKPVDDIVDAWWCVQYLLNKC